jgi:hypothetical protein
MPDRIRLQGKDGVEVQTERELYFLRKLSISKKGFQRLLKALFAYTRRALNDAVGS